ncbi:MAG: S1C family serine protease [Clostridium sp.]|jgi:serine protease Do|nr:trypsin-like peptidase domain-containing protein [Clostridium sp.]
MSDFENRNEENFIETSTSIGEDGNIKAETPKKNKKKRKGMLKRAISKVALVVVMALGGGIVGSGLTYKMLSSNDNKTTKTTASNPSAVNFVKESSDLTVAEAYNKVKPAVVTITASGKVSYSRFYSQDVEGIGSGFIINEDGNVLTNYHVIELALTANGGTNKVTVSMSDGQEVEADIVNYDKDRDIAMLKLAEGTKVPGVAELGDSDALYVGQEVIAIGTPLGTNFAQTCTKGIVSGVNRSLDESTDGSAVQSESESSYEYIQTDTAINSGNSGGPLINSEGQVIGINTAKLSNSTSSSNASIEGMGFAIPINDAKDRIESLSKKILTIGITGVSIDEDRAKEKNIPQGVGVVSVTEGSVAEKAGLKANDIITKFDGQKVTSVEDINKIKETKEAGDKVEVVVDRYNEEIKLTLEFE